MTLDHRLREAIDAFLSRVRRDIDAHVQGLMSDVQRVASESQEYWRSTLERAVTDARQDAERNFKARLEALRNELTREMETRLSTERAQLQAATIAATAAAASHRALDPSKTHVREARVDTLERLLTSVRRIDDSGSLTRILGSLSESVQAMTSRCCLLMLEGDNLKPWSSHGYTPSLEPVEIPVGQYGVLAASVALKQTSFVKPIGTREPGTPAFMQVPVGRTGLVVPLVVGGDVVALLYADDIGMKDEQEDAPLWTDEVELLARHAAIRLENITSVRTAEAFGA